MLHIRQNHHRSLLPLVCWWLGLLLVTWALVSSDPPRASAALIPEAYRFPISKFVHLAIYMGLSLGVFLLPIGTSGRSIHWGILFLHGGLTELLQTFVPGRFGMATDVVIDSAGIILGLLVGPWLWRRLQRELLAPRPACATATATSTIP